MINDKKNNGPKFPKGLSNFPIKSCQTVAQIRQSVSKEEKSVLKEEKAFGPTEASPISGLRSNLPAMGFSRALQTPEETTNNYIPLEDPSTLLAQKHFGVVTTLHCWGTHSHHSTMI